MRSVSRFLGVGNGRVINLEQINEIGPEVDGWTTVWMTNGRGVCLVSADRERLIKHLDLADRER